MAVDPVCGMNVEETDQALRLEHHGTTVFFCSASCRARYAREKQIVLPSESSSSNATCCHSSSWERVNPLIGIGLALILIPIGLSFFFPFWVPYRETVILYERKIGWALLLGLALGGLTERYVPRQYIIQILSRPGQATIFRSVFLGFLMSVCSHGILAIAMQLYKKGASTASVVTFLLASPWANLPLTLLLFSFFGWARALYLMGAALVIAVVTGLIFQRLEARGWVERNPVADAWDENFSIRRDLRQRVDRFHLSWQRVKDDGRGIWQGMLSLGNMVLGWILIGVALAGLAGAFVPKHFFHSYLGPDFMGMTVTLLFAIVVEVCSEGSAPLAFEIFRQTGALGNALVFLMAGVATDYTEIGLIWSNIGRRAAFWLPVVCVPQIFLWGLLANLIFP